VPGTIVVVKGRLSGRDGSNELLAEEMMTMHEAKQRIAPLCGAIHIKLSPIGLEDNSIDKIKQIIGAHPGQSPVILDVSVPNQGEYAIATAMSVKYSQKFFADIEKLLGQDSWELKPV
jgi:hypothetical protein